MYPLIYIYSYPIYSFGLFLLISFFVFVFLLKKLSTKYNFSLAIFVNNILWYFVSIFIFSRLFFVIAHFNNLKYMDSFSQFFATTNYDFSLFWAIFGFFIVFFINLKLRWEKAIKYLDSLVLSFLLALSIWEIWALFWWQVYWTPTDYWIELTYTNPFSPIASTPVFPLPIVYSILFFIEFSVLYILSMYIRIKGFIAYIWLIVFSLIILIFENFSWIHDIFKDNIFINFNQILAIFLMFFSFYRLYYLSKLSSKDTTIILDNK